MPVEQAPCFLAGIECRADIWLGVLQCLLDDPKAILAILQTCTSLRGLADHEHVWQSVAMACWQHLSSVQRGGYSSVKELVLDDNRANAALALCLRSACSYRFQEPLQFYQCRPLQLQWWRTTNSLRLYFDARGEADLRLPMESSLAVVQLKPGAAAAAALADATNHALRGTVDGGIASAVDSPSSSSRYDLDAWSTRLVVQAPDACHTFLQKPGHYKGVMIWHSSKTSQILKALLLQPPADDQKPGPAQQHTHTQCGRRSEAWEEWADWELEHEQLNEGGLAAADTGAAAAAESTTQHIGSMLRSCFNHLCRGQCSSNSCSSSSGSAGQQLPSTTAQAPAAASAAAAAVGGAGSSQSLQAAGSAAPSVMQQAPAPAPAPAQHALVFCYANDLNWSYTLYTPDYSITPLVVATPQQPRQNRTSSRSRSRNNSVVSQTAHHPAQQTPQLSPSDEGQLAAAWKQLPGAVMQQCGELDQQLQLEGEVEEQARWASLPQTISARGADWWV